MLERQFFCTLEKPSPDVDQADRVTFMVRLSLHLVIINTLVERYTVTVNSLLLSSPNPKSGPLRPKPKAVRNPSPNGTGVTQ